MSRWIGVLALVALTCAACGGDAPQTPAAPSSTGTTSVTQGAKILGNVSAGEPLGAMAAQVVGTSNSSPVNTGGGFSLDNVPAGAVQLRFVGSGVDASVGLNPVQSGDVVSVLVGVSGATATIQSESRNAGNKVELEGRVETLSTATADPLWLVVSGRKVTVSPSPQTAIRDGNNATKAFADLAIGQRVHVKGTLVTGPESAIAADSILIQNMNTWIPVNVNGIVEELDKDAEVTDFPEITFTFKIGGRLIGGDGLTKFYGENDVTLALKDLANGQRVEVKGEQWNGLVYAVRIHINGVPKPEDPSQDDSASVEGIVTKLDPYPPTAADKPTLEITPKTGTPAIVTTTSATVVQRRGSVVDFAALDKGQTVHAVGTRMSDGSLVARMLQIKDDVRDDETGGLFVIEGSLGGLKGTCPAITFGVNGYTVKTDEDTAYFPDTPAPGLTCTDFNKNGMKVGVEGKRLADGSVLAKKVTKK
jgi:hypothetical protein